MAKSIQVGWDWTKASNLERWKRPEGSIMELVSYFPDLTKIKVFDLGCGIGRHTVFFARLGASVSASDISEYGVNETRRWLTTELLQAKVKIGKIPKIEEPDESCDLVIAYRVIHHAIKQDIEQAVQEVYRILKPNGYFFGTFKAISEKIPSNSTKIDDQTVIWQEPPEKGIPHYYSRKEDVAHFLQKFHLIKLTYCERFEDPITDEGTMNAWFEFLAQKPT